MRSMKSGSVFRLFVCAFVLPLALNAMASSEGARGGGDICEDRIKQIREDLNSWIIKGGAQDLSLPQGISLDQYAESMLDQIKTARVKCVGAGDQGYPVMIGRMPKVCTFLNDQSGAQITCDYDKFLAADESDQYVLIHHEYAGLANIELPNKDDSQYEVSDQISGYLEEQTVKKLAVKPETNFEIKVGSRVAVDYYQAGLKSAQITEVLLDQFLYRLRTYSEPGELGDEETVEATFIKGSEVSSLKGIVKGLKADCTHPYGTFDGVFEGTVARVYSNGFVEIDISSKKVTSGKFIPPSFWDSIFWSTVPSIKDAPRFGYTCSYR